MKIKDRELYIEAEKAMKNAYAPYSDFKVGAAVVTKDGEVFTGCNIENSAYGATICAERVALSKAVSEGKKELESIAIVSRKGCTYPCGTCRQIIFEFGDDIRIIVGKDKDNLSCYYIKDLLPHGFRLEK